MSLQLSTRLRAIEILFKLLFFFLGLVNKEHGRKGRPRSLKAELKGGMWTSPGLVGHVEHLDVGGVPCVGDDVDNVDNDDDVQATCVGHPANRQDSSLDGL